MELAVGTIVSGKVTTITKFGAFVALPDGKSGLVHISEVANSFVSDVHDFLAEGQEVSVKVLAVTPEGKINLSIKQTQPRQPRQSRGAPYRPRQDRPRQEQSKAANAAPVTAPPAEPSFEDKLKQFMTASDSKQSELNRYMQAKRGGKRRK
ncbi:MAG: S1 RNA-binding domain-containing protein [Clostridiales bacterium]|nr:S1 RNA-binding domain-containing protein [Candidatus Cacconaster stercorequi]